MSATIELERTESNCGNKENQQKVLWYPSTANPHDQRNIVLHCKRFRSRPSPSVDHFHELYKTDAWKENHIHLDEMPVSRFHMDLASQRLIYKLQAAIVDKAYNSFGKTEGSWDNYTLMFRNGWSLLGDKRKPVTEIFQEYCEEVYLPLIFHLLFGNGWEDIKKHWGSFKSCTIKVCEGDQNFLGDNVFHMHIDGKVGLLQKKNYSQRHMSRLLFSIVTDVVQDETRLNHQDNGTTVYPIWQPRLGFPSNRAFHAYMQTKYHECGLKNSGLPRPHYRIPEELVYRAVSGEVLFHFTHSDKQSGPQAIHSEPNPCPDRHLFVFDWNNIVAKDESGNYIPTIEVPEDEIIEHMSVLSDIHHPLLHERLRELQIKARELLSKAEKYPGGRGVIDNVISIIDSVLE